MAFVNVTAVRTTDPSNVWVGKNSFVSNDAFAIVLDVQVDSSVLAAGLSYDVVWQIVNPRQDPYSHGWFTVFDSETNAITVAIARTARKSWLATPWAEV
jgi:hypothetical protein